MHKCVLNIFINYLLWLIFYFLFSEVHLLLNVSDSAIFVYSALRWTSIIIGGYGSAIKPDSVLEGL